MSVITDEQRIELRNSTRFQNLTRSSVANYAQFIHDNDGVSPPGISQVEWAKQRFFIAEPILQHPNAQDNETWYAQFIMFCKGMDIWQTDVDGTVQFMIDNNTFEQLANQTFHLRAENVKF